MKKFTQISLLALALFCPAPAHAGIIEFLFPTLAPRPYDPTETMRAEFADQPKQAPDSAGVKPPPAKVTLPEDHIPLDRAHKDNEEVGDWAMMTLGESLTFTKPDMQSGLAPTAKYFDAAGRAQYLAFLKDSGIETTLANGKYRMHAFVQEQPLMLNQGGIDGRYRWLVEAPVMVSFIDRSVKDYKSATPVNKKYVFILQIGRMPPKDGHSAVVIERFTVKGQKVASAP